MSYLYWKFNKRKIFSKASLGFFKYDCKSWSMVFFGSDNYSLVNLKGLHNLWEQKLIRRIEVVTINENSPIYQYSVSNGIKIHIWPPKLNEMFDFGVVASFGKLIPKSIVDHFLLGIFNVHASLLPKYRGGMPIIHALKNGEILTGVTISKISPDKFDVGEIILQKVCHIEENEVMPSLHRKLAILGCECIIEVINTLPDCLKNSFPQSQKDASYAPKLSKNVAVVKWYDMTALEVFNLYRALFGLFDLHATWEGKPLKLICLSYSHSCPLVNKVRNELEPGGFTYHKNSKVLYVQCKDKEIALCTIKFNDRMLKAGDFYSGYLQKISRALWKFGN